MICFAPLVRRTARIGSSRVQALLLLGCITSAACSDHKGRGNEDAEVELVLDASAVTEGPGQSEFPSDQPESGAAESDAGSVELLDSGPAVPGDSSTALQDSSVGEQSDASQTGADAGGDAAVLPGDGAVPFCSNGKVDLLFVVDNSGSMAEEQKKLSAVLPQLVTVLTTGHLTAANPGSPPDFPPVESLHVGVISADMGMNLAPAAQSCGTFSLNPIAPDPLNPSATTTPPVNGERLSKPFGDDGLLNISTAVAVAGMFARPEELSFATPVAVVVPGDPSCSGLALSPNQRFMEFAAGSSNPTLFAQQFSCLAKLGKNGCGIEQQLESMLKALTPSSSTTVFSRNSKGHGDVENRGFLRDEATLVIVVVSDEEDSSIPDTSSELLNQRSTIYPEDINIRCGLAKYESLLQPVARYVSGLNALKPAAYADRIVFAGIVGVPVTPGKKVSRGSAELQAVLNDPLMVFTPRQRSNSSSLEATPSCVSANNEGSAAPARRIVQVAEQFGSNGLVTSICEDEYASAMAAIVERIAVQQNGVCKTGP